MKGNDWSWMEVNILGKSVAVDAAQGNAEGTRLQDVMVGETFNKLIKES